MSYDIDFVRKAKKRLLVITQTEPKIGKKIGEQIKALAKNPEPQGSKKMKWPKKKGYHRRLRVNAYRIIYAIGDSAITIIKIEGREGVYK